MRQNVDIRLIRSVAEQARADYAYYTFMAIAGVLAAVAFLTDSVPILMGAMIVAPAYPPLALIAFALVGGFPRLAGRALAVALLGIGVAVGFAALTAWLVNLSGILPATLNLVDQPLLEERVRPGWYSVIAATAAGIAGTIATMQRRMDALIGIVASIALVPAGAAAGIALLSGDGVRAIGGLVLLLVNGTLIVALGILVLVVVRPGAEELRDREEAPEGQLRG